MYDWTMTVTYRYGTNQANWITHEYLGKQAVVKRDDLGMGAGWNLNRFERLHVQSNGALLVYGNGAAQWFGKDVFGNFLSTPGDLQFGTLAYDSGTQTYTYTAND